MSKDIAATSRSTVPKIISVDDHVVEPAHVWQSRLPAKYKDKGPRIVIAPQGDMTLVDGVWQEAPGDGGKMAAWWHYEDHRYQIKQIIACPGMKPEDGVRPVPVVLMRCAMARCAKMSYR